jgi:hypothetical protein
MIQFPILRLRSSPLLITLALLGWGTTPQACWASEGWSYKSILIGERASGLGGAFVAIADDPSGAWYNPAGLVMGQESYLSGSVNAYQSGSIRYNDVFNSQDYQYNSQGLIPSFFGMTQELSPHLKFGFVLLVKDYLNQEQNDKLQNLETDTRNLTSIQRQLLRSRTTYVTGPALSYQLSPRLMIGLSGFFVSQSEKYSDQQRALYINEADATLTDYQITQSYVSRSAVGILPKLGILALPHPRLSLGLTAAKTFSLTGTRKAEVSTTKVENGELVPPNGDYPHDWTTLSLNDSLASVLAPWEFSFGAAWFPSDDWTLTSQVDYYTEDSNFHYRAQPVLNAALGIEWAHIPQLPIRIGVYSNSWNTPQLSSTSTNQPEYINPIGVSAGLSWVSPGSSISISGAYQWGQGLGQLVGGTTSTQTVQLNQITAYLSGSYQL